MARTAAKPTAGDRDDRAAHGHGSKLNAPLAASKATTASSTFVGCKPTKLAYSGAKLNAPQAKGKPTATRKMRRQKKKAAPKKQQRMRALNLARSPHLRSAMEVLETQSGGCVH